MNLQELSFVDAEGGPLLIADAELGKLWTGIEGPDFARACDFFDSQPQSEGGLISVAHGHGLLWEMSGAGTAYIFNCSRGMIIVRSWPVDPARSDVPMLMAAVPPANLTWLGDLCSATGTLLILWATENGECVQALDMNGKGRPSGQMAIDTAGYLVASDATRFSCWHDEIENELSVARRCHIYPSAP